MSIFPLTFLSNVYVEPDTLPSGLEAFVNANPISHLTSACRGLMDGSVDAENLIVVLGTTALLTAVFLPLTTYLYRRA
jgi:ABC-2 type transport system permease protein